MTVTMAQHMVPNEGAHLTFRRGSSLLRYQRGSTEVVSRTTKPDQA